MDKGFYQYLTEHDNSNNKTNKNDTLDNFKVFIISINNT
jgi:hypothetical protein